MTKQANNKSQTSKDPKEQFEQIIDGDVVDAMVKNGKLVGVAIAPLDGFDDYMLHYGDDLLNDGFENEVRIEAPYEGWELEGYYDADSERGESEQ